MGKIHQRQSAAEVFDRLRQRQACRPGEVRLLAGQEVLGAAMYGCSHERQPAAETSVPECFRDDRRRSSHARTTAIQRGSNQPVLAQMPRIGRLVFETYPASIASRIGFDGSYKKEPERCLSKAEEYLTAQGIRLDFSAEVKKFCVEYRTRVRAKRRKIPMVLTLSYAWSPPSVFGRIWRSCVAGMHRQRH